MPVGAVLHCRHMILGDSPLEKKHLSKHFRQLRGLKWGWSIGENCSRIGDCFVHQLVLSTISFIVEEQLQGQPRRYERCIS
jgi:hypothetical protein